MEPIQLKQFNIKPGVSEHALHQSWQAYKQKNRRILQHIHDSDEGLPFFHQIIEWWTTALELKHINEKMFTTNILLDTTIRPRSSIFFGTLGRYCIEHNICTDFVNMAFSSLSSEPICDDTISKKYEYDYSISENIFKAATGITYTQHDSIFKTPSYIPAPTDIEKLLNFYHTIKLSSTHCPMANVLSLCSELRDVHLTYIFKDAINCDFQHKQDIANPTLQYYMRWILEWKENDPKLVLNAYVKLAILLHRNELDVDAKLILNQITRDFPEHKTTIQIAESLDMLESLINIVNPIKCTQTDNLPELL